MHFVISNEKYKKFASQIERMVEIEANHSLMVKKTKELIIEEIEQQKSILAIENNNVIGYISMNEYDGEIEIISAVVAEEFRNKGIGSKLFNKILEYINNNYQKKIVGLVNNNSRRIFEKNGFIEIYKQSMDNYLLEDCKNCLEGKDYPNCHCKYLVFPGEHALYIKELDYVDKTELKALCEMYCNIWKEPPWNEFYWEYEKVLNSIISNQELNNPLWLLLYENKRIVGFSFSYEVDEKLLKSICGSDNLSKYLNYGKVFYNAEIAVDKNFRRKGLAKKLLNLQIKHAKSCNGKVLLSRTKSIPAIKLKLNLGFENAEIVDYNDNERKYFHLIIK